MGISKNYTRATGNSNGNSGKCEFGKFEIGTTRNRKNGSSRNWIWIMENF